MAERIIFMGSPDFAVPVLRALSTEFNIVGVVTQPDRPSGRGKHLTPPAVKVLADDLNLDTIQPQSLRELEAHEWLLKKAPDLIVVAAFGQILRRNILELPRFGCINVHASLLPRWRGASPIQSAILHGDKVTGITIMQMDPGIDTGDMLAQGSIAIDAGMTAGELSAPLSELGARLLLETLPDVFAGTAVPQKQEDSLVTYAPMIDKAQGRMDFTQSVETLRDMVHAFNPWPVAWIAQGNAVIKVYRAQVAPDGPDGEPGEHAVIAGLPAVRAADGWLLLSELQMPGKRVVDGKAFLAGARNWLERE